MNWIYLKSDNPADALALATVISYSNDSYGIVRRTVNSFFFKGLKNVTIDFYPDCEENTGPGLARQRCANAAKTDWIT